MSLHERFVKTENTNQGKSNWWTVNLDVKSKPSRRSRSSSVDNTAPLGNTPTKTNKEKRKKTKKLSGIKLPCSTPPLGGSPLGSPMGSPRVNSPYSPAHSPLPSCASPVAGARSPALGKRNSRGTPVSPLLSPSINAEISFQSILSDSTSSLVDSNLAENLTDEAYHTLDQSTESLSSSFCNRERRGSSSSISSIASINSPLANLSLNNGSGTYNNNTAFNFHPSPISSPIPPPLHSLSQHSDPDLSHPDCMLQQMPPPLIHNGIISQQGAPPPPTYEEALYRNGCRPLHHRSSHPAHQLHISHSPDIIIRPRSTSVPVSVDFNHLPPDLDASLFNGDTGFNSIDMNNILQSEIELGGGKLDFDIEPMMMLPSEQYSFTIQQQVANKTATM